MPVIHYLELLRQRLLTADTWYCSYFFLKCLLRTPCNKAYTGSSQDNMGKKVFYFTASLRVLPALNTGTFEALIFINSPV